MSKKSYDELEASSYLAGSNTPYIEELYDQYLQNPSSLSQEWQNFFNQLSTLDNGKKEAGISHHQVIERFKSAPISGSISVATPVCDKQEAVDDLIRNYRNLGHLQADLDPLKLDLRAKDARLDEKTYGLTSSDLQKSFLTRGVLADSMATLQDIIAALKNTYTKTVGFQFEYIIDATQRDWLIQNIEKSFWKKPLDKNVQMKALDDLVAANGLEQFLEVKYPGQKRFSVEGLDATIPVLTRIIDLAAKTRIQEVVMCMAHRGRLNVMVNVLGKPVSQLCDEFAGKHEDDSTSGDVKYHLGYSSDIQMNDDVVHVSLLSNPSHLDYISPVLLGSVRARQDMFSVSADKTNYALGVMLHGDASYEGQGIIMETLVMSDTDAYEVGGIIHLVTNNQIGFTTQTMNHVIRRNAYCTDVSKTIAAPVLHVNADDMDAVLRTMQLAFDYRQQFKADIVVDLVGYRRHGHQEVDDPKATQPQMYSVIKAHPRAYWLYGQQFIQEKILTQNQLDDKVGVYRDRLDLGKSVVNMTPDGLTKHRQEEWVPYLNQPWNQEVKTGVSLSTLQSIGKIISHYPEHFTLLSQVKMIMQARKQMVAGEIALDWGAAEMLAYATLLDEGVPIRISGEDVCRGTFFHRHAVLSDQTTFETYRPLDHLDPKHHPAKMHIYDSILAEMGPLGFEYGYSNVRPKALVIWEAQFGDFSNSAQVIIDQFISSSWQKWKKESGLVMLLPHGYEGQGPEHSSARLERFLQLCAQDNMQVCMPTTPSQIFHLLRRQVLSTFRRPLIVMSPKSLLRHKLAVSSLEDLEKGRFELVIEEQDPRIKPSNVKRVICCSGKVYYDLIAQREENKQTDVAIIRIEQLYPFPYDALKRALAKYPKATTLCFAQEEPKNQGAWYMTRHRLVRCLSKGQTLILASRDAMASPAVGYPAVSKVQQQQLIDNALSLSFIPNDNT
jgi:2-oxoglutarate dehydrogenase E1 component